MRVTLLPMPEIVTLSRIITIEQTKTTEYDNELEVGTYAVDSEGRVWRLDNSKSAVVQGLEAHLPKHPEDRKQSRQVKRGQKKRKDITR